jgi:deazaflavin-dependent oxidoreductase (nitroreductase family)
MSFTTPAGTHGGSMPHGPVVRWFNQLAVGRMRRRDNPTRAMRTLVLTTTGRKSGVTRETPVAWFPGPDGAWLIVASAAGSARHPAWYLNLAAHPEQVTIEVGGRKVAVTAEELHGADRDEAWRQIVAAQARFGSYQQRTDRLLPVIRLVERT